MRVLTYPHGLKKVGTKPTARFAGSQLSVPEGTGKELFRCHRAVG